MFLEHVLFGDKTLNEEIPSSTVFWKFHPQQFSGLSAKHSEGNAEDILGQTSTLQTGVL